MQCPLCCLNVSESDVGLDRYRFPDGGQDNGVVQEEKWSLRSIRHIHAFPIPKSMVTPR